MVIRRRRKPRGQSFAGHLPARIETAPANHCKVPIHRPMANHPNGNRSHLPTGGSKPSAWALSAVVHLVLLLIIAVSWRQAASRRDNQQQQRSVGIVLAEAQDNRQIQYLDEQDIAEAAQSVQAPSKLLDDEPANDLNPLPDLQLPGIEDLPVEGTLPGTDLAGSQLGARLPGVDDVDPNLLERPVRPAGPVGPVGRVSLFGSDAAAGRSFVFVIDRSKSMGGQGLNALSAAQKQLDRALAELVETHQFQVIAYHDKPVYFPNRTMAKAVPGNRQRLKEFFGGLAAFGGTNHELAVLAGLRVKPDVLFLLTDGASPELNRVQLDRVRRRSGGLTTIHCIQFGFGPLQEQTSFMQKLAAENGGQFHYVDMRKR